MTGILAKLVARARDKRPLVTARPASRFEPQPDEPGDLLQEIELRRTVSRDASRPPATATWSSADVPARAAADPREFPAETAGRAPRARPESTVPDAAAPAQRPPQTETVPVAQPPAPIARSQAPHGPGSPPSAVAGHEVRIEREVIREIARDGPAAEATAAPEREPRQARDAPGARREPAPSERVVQIIERILPSASERPAQRPPVPGTPTAEGAAAQDPPAPAAITDPPRKSEAVPHEILDREPGASPTVHVHIDRIDVRTTPPAPSRMPVMRRGPAPEAAPSLESFLAGRKGRRR